MTVPVSERSGAAASGAGGLGARARYWLFTVFAWCVVLMISFPLIWMVLSSLKSNQEIQASPPTFLPLSITLDQYRDALKGDFPQWFVNSLVIASGTTLLSSVVGTLAAYSLARLSFSGQKVFSVSVVLAYLFPKILMLVPLVIIIRELHITNTYVTLIIANTTFALPFTLWLLRGFFSGLPIELEQAAMIDGASRLSAIWDVVIPQALPGIISTATFAFILAWNEYLFALTFTTQDNTTLPVGLSQFSSELNVQWGPLMAASVAVTVPIVLLLMIFQRRFTTGLTEGGIRG